MSGVAVLFEHFVLVSDAEGGSSCNRFGFYVCMYLSIYLCMYVSGQLNSGLGEQISFKLGTPIASGDATKRSDFEKNWSKVKVTVEGQSSPPCTLHVNCVYNYIMQFSLDLIHIWHP